jgi:23S rRNA U2552 (ribose-2'-O)-methylase RlmE/FtsJ
MESTLQLSKTDTDYKPKICKLIKTQKIEDIDYESETSENMYYPQFTNGFQHYIHQSKDKMENIKKEFEGKKQVHHIINKFDRYIDNSDKDINTATTKYFNLEGGPILSRAFFKLWEMFFYFDLIPLDRNVITAHLAEGPGSFIQGTIFFRDMFGKNSKNDKYFAITLHSEKEHVPPLEEKFVDYYSKEKPKRFYQQKTYPANVAKLSGDKIGGDLTSLKTITQFAGSFKDNKADFVSGDGGFNWKNENTQEQEGFRLILGQTITALKIQAIKGNYVCKIFESFTDSTIKLLCLLNEVYETVYICKPLMSRESNSERYIICLNYKGIQEKKLKLLEKVLDKKEFVSGFMKNYNIDNKLRNQIININTNIANRQFISINEMATYVENQNYRGEEYNKRLNDKEKAAKYWTELFYPNEKNFDNHRKSIRKEFV